MSFIKKAQEAAEAARAKVEEAASSASRTANDPSTTEKINQSLSGASQSAREAVGLARRGVNTVIERIDPGTLAELIIKATALQELTNGALRTKGSPYRISEISIAATIPPGVNFAISRIDDVVEALEEVRESRELVEGVRHDGEVVIALDGATLDQTTAEAIAEAAAVPGGAMPPSSVSRPEPPTDEP